MKVVRRPIYSSALRYLVEDFNGPALNSDWDGSAGTYTFKGKEFVSWTGKTNVTETANSTLTKTGGTNGVWDAGAYSTEQAASGDIKIEARIKDAALDSPGVAVAISNLTDAASVDPAVQDFLIVTFAGNLYKDENGTVTSLSTGYVVDDVIGVEVKGGVVNYLKNGLVIGTNASPTLSYPLCGNLLLNGSGAVLSDCKISTPSAAPSFIDLTAGFLQSVRTNLDLTGKTITIHTESLAAGDWFLVIGDLAGSTYLIEIRYQPSLGKVRLTQHYGGADHHVDFNYSSIKEVEWVQLAHLPGGGGFEFTLYTSSDGITFNFAQGQARDVSFVLNNVGAQLDYISGAVQLENFDSNIVL